MNQTEIRELVRSILTDAGCKFTVRHVDSYRFVTISNEHHEVLRGASRDLRARVIFADEAYRDTLPKVHLRSLARLLKLLDIAVARDVRRKMLS